MLLTTALLAAAAWLPQDEAPQGRATVYRLDRIDTLEGEALENATIIIREGVIEKIGKTVIVPENAEVIDLRGSGASAMPPLVLSHANFLQRDSRGRGRNGRFRGLGSLYLTEDDLPDLLEQGVLIAGVDPPGSGIPGRTSVLATTDVHPKPEGLVRDLHLKLTMQANSSAKDLLRKALKDADKAIEAEAKARAEWEKARKEWEEKQKQGGGKEGGNAEGNKNQGGPPQGQRRNQGGAGGNRNRGRMANGEEGDDGEQDKNSNSGGNEKEEGPPEEFVPPKIDQNLEPVVEWVRGQRVTQVWMSRAHEWLHWQEVLGDRELPYELVLSFTTSQNIHEVAEQIGDLELRVYVPARLSFLPQTRLRSNPALELAEAGAKLVLRPPVDTMEGVKTWRQGIADVVREGLARETALSAVSTEPAAAMGQEDRVQPLIAGAPATFVIFGGDVLDPTSKVDFVIEEGEVIYDRAKEEEKKSR